MHLKIFVYTLIIENEEEVKAEVGETMVFLARPSKEQCMKVIAQMNNSQPDVVLFSLARDCIELVLPFILKRRGVTGIFMNDTPMHGLAHPILSEISILRSLVLAKCSLNDDDVIPLARALTHHTSIYDLSFSYNPGITSDSAHALAENLPANRSLGLLSLQGANISHHGFTVLFESLRRNTKVKLLISEEVESICKAIPSYYPVIHRIEFDN